MNSTLQISMVALCAVILGALFADVEMWFRITAVVSAMIAVVFTAALATESNRTGGEKK